MGGMEQLDAGKDTRTGRFLSGNKFRPPTSGRKKLPDLQPALESLEASFPSASIGQELRALYDLAVEKKMLKVALAIMELRMAYQYGKPVTRQLSVSTDLEAFQELFAPREGSNAETLGDVVEATAEVVG